MLSGIKRGKKKKSKSKSKAERPSDADNVTTAKSVQSPAAASGASDSRSAPSAPSSKGSYNASIADQLRQSLLSGDMTALSAPAASKSQFGKSRHRDGSKRSKKSRRTDDGGDAVDHLESRGRIDRVLAAKSKRSKGEDDGSDDEDEQGPVIFHLGSNSNKKEEDMTAAELAAQERRQTEQGMSLDEQMMRNLVRVGRKRRRKIGKNDDSDDEVKRLQKLLPGEVARKKSGASSDRPPTARQLRDETRAKQREEHRALAQYNKQEKVTDKCSWWMESSSFAKHRLIALGDYVALVIAPPNASLEPGNHFYLVPVKYAESFTTCDSSVWDEVRRFLSSLKRMFAKDDKGIVFMETVMPNKKGLWQTKLEVIPVPNNVLQDAPIFFKSAMLDQTEDWGTHNKILSTTPTKPLIAVVPKNFPYFYIEWGSVQTSANTGYAQIIESSSFRHDFGLDTLASMLELDPVRFSRKRRFDKSQERKDISAFLDSWKDYDWTLQLDG